LKLYRIGFARCSLLLTGKTDRAVKMPLYVHYGVKYVWLVDPDLQLLEAYQLQTESSGNKWMLFKTLRDDQEVCLPPFAEISFALSVLWE